MATKPLPAARITAPAIAARKHDDTPIVMVTAYDAPTARIADGAGVDVILVGDSVANVVLGYEDTLQVTTDDMAHHVGAVARTQPNALVVGDLPWLSYHVSTSETVHNAARLIRAGAGAVKLEGGRKRLDAIQAILDAEIPVMGHLGLTPQSVHALGGFRVQASSSSRPGRSSTTRSRWPRPGASRWCSSASRTGSPGWSPTRSTSRRSGSARAGTATARCSCTTTCSGWRTARSRSSCGA